MEGKEEVILSASYSSRFQRLSVGGAEDERVEDVNGAQFIFKSSNMGGMR